MNTEYIYLQCGAQKTDRRNDEVQKSFLVVFSLFAVICWFRKRVCDQRLAGSNR